MLQDVGIADQQKAWKQGRDDSIKQFGMQPHPTYLSTLKICRVELCTEQFYAIIPTLFLCMLFADLLSLLLVAFLLFFYSYIIYSKSDGVLCLHYSHMRIVNSNFEHFITCHSPLVGSELIVEFLASGSTDIFVLLTVPLPYFCLLLAQYSTYPHCSVCAMLCPNGLYASNFEPTSEPLIPGALLRFFSSTWERGYKGPNNTVSAPCETNS